MALDINAIRDSVKGISGGPKFPTVIYVPNGSLQVRFYIDRENQILRTFNRHVVKFKGTDNKDHTLHFRCMQNTEVGCPVCDHINHRFAEYPEFNPGWKWEFGSRNVTIAYATIFKAETQWPVKTLNSPIVLMSGKKFASELSEMVQKLPNEEMVKAFTPETVHHVWEIKCKDFGKESFSVSILSWDQKAMEPLPDDAPPLSMVYYKEGELPSRDMMSDFIARFDAKFDIGINIKEPAMNPKTETPPWLTDKPAEKPVAKPVAAFVEEPAEEPVQESIPELTVTSTPTGVGIDISKIKSNIEKPAKKVAPKATEEVEVKTGRLECFSKYDQKNVPCLVCDDNDACIEATANV